MNEKNKEIIYKQEQKEAFLKKIEALGYNTKIPKIRKKKWAEEFLDAVFNKDYTFYLVLAPRQANKDITCLRILGKYMNMNRPTSCAYIAHERQATIDILVKTRLEEGEEMYKILGFVKKAESKYEFKSLNGSTLKCYGCDKNQAPSLVGRNYDVIVFTEASRQPESVFNYLIPTVNKRKVHTKVILVTTPFGCNHIYKMFINNYDNPKWYVKRYTIYDMSPDEYNVAGAEEDKEIMEPWLWEQEYLCTFNNEKDSSLIYLRHLNASIKANRIGKLNFEGGIQKYDVYTAWDLGQHDDTVILFFCIDKNITGHSLRKNIYIIDMLEFSGKGFHEIMLAIKSKIEENGYKIAKHFLPHDGNNEYLQTYLMSGVDQIRALMKESEYEQLDTDANVLARRSVWDGIWAVRELFPRFYIDKVKCDSLVSGLREYRRKYDANFKSFVDKPDPRQSCRHKMDALRYLATACKTFGLVDDL